MFLIIRDIDPRRPELMVRRVDGGRWVTTDEGNCLVVNSKSEARALVEALMEQTMLLDPHTGEFEDA